MKKQQFERDKVTVVIPVYNEERFLREALESVVEQVDCVIIGDNASTDGTEAICREFVEKYSHIVYFRNEKNVGSAENFNLCYERVTTEFCFHMGGHDLVPENYVAELKKTLSSCPESIAAFAPVREFYDDYPDNYRLFDLEIFRREIQNDDPLVRAAHFFSEGNCSIVYGLFRSNVFCGEMRNFQPIAGCDVVFLFSALLRGKMVFSDNTFFLMRNVHAKLVGSESLSASMERIVGEGRFQHAGYDLRPMIRAILSQVQKHVKNPSDDQKRYICALERRLFHRYDCISGDPRIDYPLYLKRANRLFLRPFEQIFRQLKFFLIPGYAKRYQKRKNIFAGKKC